MNAEEAILLWNRKDDVEQAGGHAAHRQLALKHLKLKTVIKVRIQASHTASVGCVASSGYTVVSGCCKDVRFLITSLALISANL